MDLAPGETTESYAVVQLCSYAVMQLEFRTSFHFATLSGFDDEIRKFLSEAKNH